MPPVPLHLLAPPADRPRPRDRATREAGFTLVELLVVLAILGLIVALVSPQVLKYLGRAKTDTARIEIQSLSNALDLYHLDLSRFPTQQEGLQALVEPPSGADKWNGPYLKQKKVPLDPWGRPYIYRIPGEHGEYDLYTLGADNAPGGTGENQDIGNW
ncbi:MAG TPA: type II secretion system major pseudopilin GspG [Alphaproteobacteria bacterium]|nr:type II secretion system major pseudopilin GspG [Alphaproteobacteria bacterium]